MPSWKKVIVSGSNASLNSLFATSVTASIFSGSAFTGSLFGTASWAQNAISASFAPPPTNVYIQGGNSFGVQAVLGTNDAQNLAFETSGSVRMIISGSNGNIGIGTTTAPTEKLEVNGNITFQTFNPGYVLRKADSETTIISSSRSDNTQDGQFRTDGWGNFTFNKAVGIGYSLGTVTSGLYVNGNVGIGTTTPNARLDVNGNTIITGSLTVTTGSAIELQVTNTGVKIGNAITDIHTVTGSLNISGSVTATNFTGSLFGTSSWATNVITASYVLNAISASYARTASFVNPLLQDVQITGSLNVSASAVIGSDSRINGLTIGKGGGNVASNTAVGFEAINATATGIANTVMGYTAGRSITTGAGNTIMGWNSGKTITTGQDNVIIGASNAELATSGISYNTLIGNAAGYSLQSNYNTLIGYFNGIYLTTGTYNTFLGTSGGSGNGITTGNYNTIIGSQITGLASSLSNTIILADGQGNQRIRVSNAGNVLIGTTTDAGYNLDVTNTARVKNNADSYYALTVGDAAISNGRILLASTTNQDIESNSGGKIRFTAGDVRFQTNATGQFIWQLNYGTSNPGIIYNDGDWEIPYTGTNAASALFQLTSTTKGFRPPVMTSAQRDAISSPAAGLIVYQTTGNYLSLHNGTNWVNLISDTGSVSISGSVTATNFTGSLFGTASWALNVVGGGGGLSGGTADYIPLWTSTTTQATSSMFQSGSSILVSTTTGSGNFRFQVSGSDVLVNNVRIGRGASNITSSTAIGTRALDSVTTGTNNVAVGFEALKLNDVGAGHVAVGFNALVSASGLFIGNIGIGNRAGEKVTNASYNILIGSNAGNTITTGQSNTIIGSEAYLTPSGSSLLPTGSDTLLIGTGASRIKIWAPSVTYVSHSITTNITEINAQTYSGGVMDYVVEVYDGTNYNQRAGTLWMTFDPAISNIVTNEQTTADIGDTSGITLSVTSSANIALVKVQNQSGYTYDAGVDASFRLFKRMTNI